MKIILLTHDISIYYLEKVYNKQRIYIDIL